MHQRRQNSFRQSREQTRKSYSMFHPAVVENKFRSVVSRSFQPMRRLVRSASLKCLRFQEHDRSIKHEEPMRVRPSLSVQNMQEIHDYAADQSPNVGIYDVNRSAARYQSMLSKSAICPPGVNALAVERRAKHLASRMDSPWARPPRISVLDTYNQWHCSHIHTPWYPSFSTRLRPYTVYGDPYAAGIMF